MRTTASRLIWSGLSALPPPVAAKVANAVFRDRRFTVDADGDWIFSEGKTVIASPDVYGLRIDLIKRQTEEYFLQTYRPASDDTVVDIGAGIGEEVVSLADRVRRIVAVEAHPRTFRCLDKTVRMSGFTSVEAIHCAISNADGTVRISDMDHHLSNSIASKEGEEVPALTLDALCKRACIREIDFLKINIEGAERLLLEGWQSIPARHVAISCHDFVADVTGNAFFRTKELVRSALELRGYKVIEGQSDKPWVRDTLYGDLPSVAG